MNLAAAAGFAAFTSGLTTQDDFICQPELDAYAACVGPPYGPCFKDAFTSSGFDISWTCAEFQASSMCPLMEKCQEEMKDDVPVPSCDNEAKAWDQCLTANYGDSAIYHCVCPEVESLVESFTCETELDAFTTCIGPEYKSCVDNAVTSSGFDPNWTCADKLASNMCDLLDECGNHMPRDYSECETELWTYWECEDMNYGGDPNNWYNCDCPGLLVFSSRFNPSLPLLERY